MWITLPLRASAVSDLRGRARGVLQLIPGDDQALRSRAGQLSAVASSIQTVIEQVRSAEQQVKLAGTNTLTAKLASALQKDQTLLGNACSVLQQAGQCLNELAVELEQIDAEAVQQRRQVEASPARAFMDLTYLEPYLQRADSARTAAASQLTRLTNQAPGLPRSSHHGFLRDVWDGTLGGLLSGLWGAGKGAWDLTGEGFFNTKEWEKSWSNTIHDADQIGEHPGAFAAAVWDGISESDLRHKDPAAWTVAMVINVASLFVGVGEVKGALELTKIGDALKASEVMGDTELLTTGKGLNLPQDFFDHTTDGYFNSKNKPVGFHSAPGGITPEGRQIDRIVAVNGNGTYRAEVSFQRPDGTWVPKIVPVQTMFPDSWTRSDVEQAIQAAWNTHHMRPDGKWEGEYNGVTIIGYEENGVPTTAFPEPNQ